MKLLALFFFVGFAAASSEWNWQSNQEYVFHYTGRMLTGLPELQRQWSGVGIECEVVLQVQDSQPFRQQLALQLKNVKFVSVNDKLQPGPSSRHGYEDPEASSNWRKLLLPEMQPVSQEYKQYLTLPVTFNLENGEVKNMIVSETEPTWSVNMKKALVTMFQAKQGGNPPLDTQGNNTPRRGEQSGEVMWKVVEETIDGQCEHTYTLHELPEYMIKEKPEVMPFPQGCQQSSNMLGGGPIKYYELVKMKDVSSCRKRASYSFVKPGFFNCPEGNCDGMWTRSSITRFYACGPSSGQLHLQTIINEGELTQNLLGVETEKFITGTSQIFSLKHMGSISQPIQPVPQPESVDSMMYVYDFFHKNPQQVNGKGGLVPSSLAESGEIRSVLPKTVGMGGEKEPKINSQKIKQEMKKWVNHLIQDLTEPSAKVPEKQITSQILTITRGLSMLSKSDIQEVYSGALNQVSGSQNNQQTVSDLFVDLSSMAGTNANIEFVLDRVVQSQQESQGLTKMQKAAILIFLPHYVMTPTHQLLERLFQIVTKNEQVKDCPILHSAGILGMTNLFNKACLSPERQQIYPTSVFGEFCEPNSQIITEQFIPYLSSELRQCQPGTWKQNLYVFALGSLRHKHVIPILTPLVENATQQVQPMTRMIAIYSLGVAGQQQPSRVASMLQSIFANPSESTQARKAAFDSLLKLNPSMTVFQQIASSTWYEQDQEILKLVNTALRTLAYQETYGPMTPSWSQDNLAMKAKTVLPFIKQIPELLPTTGSVWTSEYMPKLGVGYSGEQSWLSSKDSIIPSQLYGRMQYIMGQLQFQTYEYGLKFTGFENLYQQFTEIFTPVEPGKTAEQERKEEIEKFEKQLNQKWRTVIESLKIQPREDNQMNGAAFLHLMEDTSLFASFNNWTVEKIRNKITPYLRNPLKLHENICGEHQLNAQKAFDIAPAEFLIPSDLGLPIIIEVHMPVGMSLRGKMNIQCNGQSQLPSISLNVRSIYTSQYSGWVGTLSPFSNEIVSTGIQEHFVLNMPTDIKMELDLSQSKFSFTLTPYQTGSGSNPMDILHYHIRPYTVKQKLDDFTPFTLGENIKYIHSDDQPLEFGQPFGDYLGLDLKAEMKTESPYADRQTVKETLQMFNYNPMNMLRFGWVSAAVSKNGQPSVRSHYFKIIYNPAQSSSKEIGGEIRLGYMSKQPGKQAKYFTLKVKSSEEMKRDQQEVLEIIGQGQAHFERHVEKQLEREEQERQEQERQEGQRGSQQQHQQGQHYSSSGSSSSGSSNSDRQIRRNIQKEELREAQKLRRSTIQSRGKEILKKLSPIKFEVISINEERHPRRQEALKRGLEKTQIESGSGVCLVTKLYIQGSRPRTYSYTMSGVSGQQELNQKWSLHIESDQSKEKICIDGHSRLQTPIPRWNLDTIRSSNIQYQYVNNIGFGKECQQSQIKISGHSKVSQRQKQYSSKSQEGQRCTEAMSQQQPGAHSSYACQQARIQAMTIDQVDFEMQYTNVPDYIVEVEKTSVNLLKAVWWPFLQTPNQPQSPSFSVNGQNVNDRQVSFQLSFYPQYQVADVVINQPEQETRFRHVRIPTPLRWIYPMVVTQSSFRRVVGPKPVCSIEHDYLRTYDNRTNQVKIDDCWHLASGDCGAKHNFAVFTKSKSQNQNTQVKIIYQDLEIDLTPGQGYSKFYRDVHVKVNGEQVKLSKNEPKTVNTKFGDYVQLQLTSDEVIQVESKNTYRVSVQFDGKTLEIRAPWSMRNKLCGLCGDYNSQKKADIRGPQQCVYSRPEVAVAAWRVPSLGGNCPALPSEVQQRLERETSECSRFEIKETKIQKAFEFQNGKCTKQQHVILERAGELCFSRQPVKKCGQTCQPQPTKPETKTVSFTCLPQGRLAQHYQQKAKEGREMRELEDKPESFSTELHLPERCVPIHSHEY